MEEKPVAISCFVSTAGSESLDWKKPVGFRGRIKLFIFSFFSLQLHSWALPEADEPAQKSHSKALTVVQRTTSSRLGIGKVQTS